ncbi:hypothetical protein PENSPDRAFT_757641 [Peniophora sp. CONT]|nr:hypothetical protein PENSPDRAFT_757641 [Peniophora sp. CONT]
MAAVSQPFHAPTLDLSPPPAAAVEELPSYDASRAHALTSNLRRGPYVSERPFSPSADEYAHEVTSDLRRDPYLSEHSFSIRTAKGVPWLTMHLRSRATSAKYLPLYCDRDKIRGDVTLQLQADMRVKAIVLKYRCTVSEQGSVPHRDIVLDMEHCIWAPSGGASFGVLHKGRHVMPFMFLIPDEVPNPKEPGTMAALPPTFSERGGSSVYVDYTLSVSFRKPGPQISRKITTGVGYFPRSVCGTPSPLRSLASQNNISPPGPELDPRGWRILSSVKSSTTELGTRVINTMCTLAVAEPLSFAVGSSIPVFLTIRSPDSHALELAASGASVQLRRVIEIGRRGSERRHGAVDCKYIADAVFWSYERDTLSYEEGTRELQGEVVIPKGTMPSFTFTNIVLRYEIVLCDPTIPNPYDVSHKALVSDMKSRALCSTSVAVTVASPRQVVPLSSSPPAYSQ